MNNEFFKPYLDGEKAYFCYNREDFIKRPIFPTVVFDGGAFFFANDHFKTTDGDFLLEKVIVRTSLLERADTYKYVI